MTSHLSDDPSRIVNHQWPPFWRAVLFSGMALLTVLLIANQAGAQSPDRVHTAIVTCECPDAEQACHPLVLDSSFTPAPAVETACNQETLDTTCAKCLRAVASQIGGDKQPAPIPGVLLPDILTYSFFAYSPPFAGGVKSE